MNQLNKAVFLAFAVLTQISWAKEDNKNPGLPGNFHSPFERVRHERPFMNGQGCPAGTFDVSVSPDGTAVTFLFDRFKAEAGKTTGKNAEQLDCVVRVPIDLPDGMQLETLSTDLRGFNSLPPKGRSRITSIYYFNARKEDPIKFHHGNPFLNNLGHHGGLNSNVMTKDFLAETGDFTVTFEGGPGVIRRCDHDSIKYVDVQISLTVASNMAQEPAQIQLDSADTTQNASVVMKATSSTCKFQGHGNPHHN